MAAFYVISDPDWITCLLDRFKCQEFNMHNWVHNTLRNLWWQSSAMFSHQICVSPDVSFLLTCYLFSHFWAVDITSAWEKSSSNGHVFFVLICKCCTYIYVLGWLYHSFQVFISRSKYRLLQANSGIPFKSGTCT